MTWPFTGGLPETSCGAGSTLSRTESVRRWLPNVLRKYEVRRLLDIPCGDFNWMAQTDLSSVDYIGIDSDPRHLDSAIARLSKPASFGPKSRVFSRVDVLTDSLPFADCVLCRDFLQHLPTRQADYVIDKFLKMGARFLIMTSHLNEVNEDLREGGQFRPLNLTRPPLSLCDPTESVEDNGRILGLWLF